MNFNTSLAAISCFVNMDGTVTFLLYDLECYFLNYVYKKVCSLEFKNSFGKYNQTDSKNP